ncbi:copper homeostasis protein CutC [Flavobacterium algicola]|uniref:copper homeostasis protein CutC n=1 Tax=Flavobacterium algicola TaxID=556529 RepID=UPI001EFD1B80|nr:copper homeostasis protein CutC [Flavobacterium algicola]MCG9792270.1 copper homeostasis protein CutC [Flavobacterium algicola]
MNKFQLEIACFNLESARTAQAYGADRVELCANMKAGGTTPEYDIVEEARKQLSIRLNVMIRPRGGDFVYSSEEFEEMKKSITKFKRLDVDGFVFGILDKNNRINTFQNAALVKLAHPLPCTFHKAFDIVDDIDQALNDIINCGFTTLLTAGQGSDVIEGLDVITELVKKANDKIVIMPGGGLRSSNIKLVHTHTSTSFYHSSAIVDNTEDAAGNEIIKLQNYLQS